MNKKIDFAKMKVSSQLGDHLGKNLYSTNEEAVDEFLQNAFDAKATIVSLTIEEGYIQIVDNGEGFDRKDIDAFAIWGAERKKGKGLEGNKGIGRFAGWKLGKVIIVITKNVNGEGYEFKLDSVNFFKDEGFDIFSSNKTNQGASIVITGLNNPKYFLEKKNLDTLKKNIIRDRALLNRKILLNGEELKPEHLPFEGGFRKKIGHSISGMMVTGEIGLATKNCAFSGILFKVNKDYKPVGNGRCFGIDTLPKYYGLMDRVRGVVVVPSLYGKINTTRTDFEECKEKRVIFDYVKEELIKILDKKIKQVNKYNEEKYEKEFNKFLKDMNKLLEEFEKREEIVKERLQGIGKGEEDKRKLKSGETHPYISEEEKRRRKKKGGVEVEDDLIGIDKNTKGVFKLDGLSYSFLHLPMSPENTLVIVNHHKLIIIINKEHICYSLYCRHPKNFFFLWIEVMYNVMITSERYNTKEILDRINFIMNKWYKKQKEK